ncbi:melanopsin-like [Orbicella faveolata]|uniref:melanopsin-like n=1 Tax=Orbicella faveolata TaxID=48498 RepID=UPI0009E5001D|nr:melanopsin-like [Orbicella faveolata]
MDLETASECNTTANFTVNVSSCPQPIPAPPSGPIVNPYNEFYKFAFGSAIYMIIVSFINVVANGFLLLVFFIDPLKIFRNATTYFLIGIAFVDIFIAATQQPMYSTCFIMMHIRHPDTVKTCTDLLNIGQTMSLTAMNASFLIVLAFTVTQYIVVISPLNHARKVTKTRVIICVLAIYAYAILFSVSPEMGVPRDIQQKIDNTFHSIALIYLTIIFYILLYIAFKKKMAASKRLREDRSTQEEEKNDRQTGVERKFIIVNFLLIAILFLTSQPSAMLWIIRLYSNEDVNSPKVLIINLWVDNMLYVKFLLDPFVYAWRIPKYRQALRIMLRCGGEETRNKSTSSELVMARMSTSRETVITLDLKRIFPK